MKLVDIKRTKADRKAEQERYSTADELGGDDYPWGLNLRLDDATIKKIGLGDVDADQAVRVYAEAFVSEDTVNKRNGKSVRNVTLQITKLAVAQSESDDDAADDMYSTPSDKDD